jgi:hypothetical protein
MSFAIKRFRVKIFDGKYKYQHSNPSEEQIRRHKKVVKQILPRETDINKLSWCLAILQDALLEFVQELYEMTDRGESSLATKLNRMAKTALDESNSLRLLKEEEIVGFCLSSGQNIYLRRELLHRVINLEQLPEPDDSYKELKNDPDCEFVFSFRNNMCFALQCSLMYLYSALQNLPSNKSLKQIQILKIAVELYGQLPMEIRKRLLPVGDGDLYDRIRKQYQRVREERILEKFRELDFLADDVGVLDDYLGRERQLNLF